MSDDFSTWMLAQLQDPKLREKAKERMEKSPFSSSSPAKASTVSSSPAPSSSMSSSSKSVSPVKRRFIQVAKPHEEGFWKTQLLQGAPYRASFPATAQLQRQVDDLFEQTAEKAYALRLARTDYGNESDAPPADKLPSYLLTKLHTLTEGLVCDHYRGRKIHSHFDDAYLSFALGPEGKNALEAFLSQAISQLPAADEETLRYFGFDKKGRPILWWDPDGILRDHYEVDEKTVRRLQEQPALLSKMWTLPPLVMRVVFLYDAVMDVIEEAKQKQDVRWNNRMMRDYLFDTACGRETINPYYYTILTSFLRLAEARVRVEIAGIAPIQTERDRREVSRRLPKSIEDEVMEALEKTPLPPITEEDVRLLPAEDRLAARIRLKWLFLLPDDEKRLAAFDAMCEKEVVSALNRREFREQQSPTLMRLQRFFALRRKKQEEITQSAIREVVDSSWEEELRRTLRDVSPNNPHWVSELAKQLDDWQSPKVRSLRLNRTRIREAKKELAKTVAMVDRLLTTETKEEVDDE
ncbi:hypothetical protein [Murdochiella massiliensis]|uniref:hypothetical protein n=1 Tax=Murdochiella massiliensis TaxID=1673723 RepID=UPI000829EF63|nr:hypothetical protein [Murdochiella massiliensis]